MRWQGREQSSNVEDRTGQGGGGLGGGLGRGGFGNNPFGTGGGIPIPTGRGGGISFGGIAILIIFALIAMAFGLNPLSILTGDDGTTNSSFNDSTLPPSNADTADMKSFVRVVLKDTENFWGNYFSQHNASYTPTTLVMYDNQTTSGCGTADASGGPFYCPDDKKVYIDLSFYQQLRDQFGAPGDFAQAYVIAHEVGHHVQDLLGILPKFNDARQHMSQDQQNAYSVKIELQADCFAGMWAKGEQQYLDNGDVQEAINAANQIGDDTLTHNSISPRQYTHGTSAQRMQWFKTGYNSTDVSQCDTGLPS